MGIQWSFCKGTKADRTRYRLENGALVLNAQGTSPADSSPLSLVAGDHHNVAYEFLSLRPALYAAGAGEARFRNFRYRALP